MNDVLHITDIGKRDSNQDSIVVDKLNSIYLLADGMGGGKHNAGDLCSHVATQIMYKKLLDLKESLDIDRVGKDRIERRLKKVMNITNEVISSASVADNVKNWGTTLDACFIHDKEAYIAHSGDSVIYHINLFDESVNQLTTSHNVNYAGLDNLAREEQNIILSQGSLENYVGCGETFFADTLNLPFTEGDILLMATDGLSKTVSKNEMLRLALESEKPALKKGFFASKGMPELACSLVDKLIKLSKSPVEMRESYGAISGKGHNISLEKSMGDNTSILIIYGGGKNGN